MDWKDIAAILGSFAGGLLLGLLKAFIPGYSDLAKRVADLEDTCHELRAENQALREKNEGLYDALEDER